MFFFYLKTPVIRYNPSLFGTIFFTRVGGLISLVENEASELLAASLALSYHSIYLSLCVGGQATDITIYILMVGDFLINMVMLSRTYILKKRSQEKNAKKLQEAVQMLLISEMLEVK